MCFFAIVGIVPKERVIGQEMMSCPMCNIATLHETIESRLWFIFFFIPLFPVSGKHTYTRCTRCGLSTQ